ncbi:magnesium transporter CorA family protein [Planomicrobium okeanokoites]|uniref:Magnesium transporter CorA family protein n=1 Tax=Planomicrobium okeanokoites TaxID=244 RepID=A0ABV7KSY8_PLAOK|nr:magnesium transporter CorA family protein [Planomicrobium okeanokoites]TAA65868.1 magnesium transporter CorA [Planomicrobium okeanokoites]
MKEHAFSNNQWKWIEVDLQTEEAELQKLIPIDTLPDEWDKQGGEEEQNNLQMNRNINHKKAIWGSLVYKLKPHDKDSRKVFRFYLSEDTLITGNLDFLETEGLDKELVLQNMATADTAIEGMMAIIDEVIASILIQVDATEVAIRKLLWELQKSNGQKVLNQLIDLRHQLLLLKNLTIPVQEIHMVIEEAFDEKHHNQPLYKRADKQLDRCHYLIREYTQEVSTMVSVEDVTASVAGNEIMKTLTVITLLFTPISAWGAWWGMNFKHMPELNWTYAYLFAGIFIMLNTLLLYSFLKKKGWLGDLLKRNK